MKKQSGVYVTSYKRGGWEKDQTVEKVVATDAGGAKFVILSIEPTGECKASRWIDGGRATYTILYYRVTYVVLPKTRAREALQKIVDEYTRQQVKNIAALFLPAMKAVGMK